MADRGIFQFLGALGIDSVLMCVDGLLFIKFSSTKKKNIAGS